ncbi:MAG: (R)-specific enoyl-CoA hydratase [Promethearchaeota archaeon]|nr:MAG: (R)-specific enoyl-CoA hydratase [Candidatus Lokiarchaeota archaeon]
MSKSNLKSVKWEDYKVGDSASHSKTVTEADVVLFAGITGDFNPLHINEEFAKTQMFGTRVVHGAFSSGLISAVLGIKLFGPGILYGSQNVMFKKPVYIGDTLTAVATVKEKYTKKDGKLKFIKVDTKVYNQKEEVVTDGEAEIIFM